MSLNPEDRRYSKTHEWYLVAGDVVTMGITKFAADELTDITYVELPAVGSKVHAGESFGEIESVKTTSELFSAFSGEVIEANVSLNDHPELVNDDSFGKGWLLKIRVANLAPFELLMDAPTYNQTIGHR